MSEIGITAINEKVRAESAFVAALRGELEKVIVGQRYMLDRLLIGLLANGHLLLEGVPGLAKTLAVKTLAQAIHTDFQRIQFTPDLLPADLIGTQIYNPKTGDFGTRKGPIFANLILADEINRAPAKAQSALLEAMQERQVTIGRNLPLPDPFLVSPRKTPLSRKAPIPPEAQVDRFMLKLVVSYPTLEEERRILDANARTDVTHRVNPSWNPTPSAAPAKPWTKSTWTKNQGLHPLHRLRHARPRRLQHHRPPRQHPLRRLPRATLYLTLAARAHAFLQGRGYVTRRTSNPSPPTSSATASSPPSKPKPRT